MKPWPLRFRQQNDGRLLFSDDAGGFFVSTDDFLERYAHGTLSLDDCRFLETHGHIITEEPLSLSSFAYRYARRLFIPGKLTYVILVPTLRCNLTCDYCQVARTNLNAIGFDWSDETVSAAIDFLDTLETNEIKIEFQGGEPLVRLDLLERIRDFCRNRFEKSEFVVCTNLQSVSERAWAFLEAQDTHLSTSLDGDFETHLRQRTKTKDLQTEFIANLQTALLRLGPDRVSAIATVDPRQPPTASSVINTFADLGLRSIYVRPVNYQGFARKRFLQDNADTWANYYNRLIDALIQHNSNVDDPMEEYYFTHCLRRVVRGGHDNHADLRNPNILGADYLVIDYDGTFYPTDEARMVTRVGHADLSVGDLANGIDETKLEWLNWNSLNTLHEDCVHCTYQCYCGVDLVDDISRYARSDLPKHLTDHCRRHLAIFDKVFEVLYSDDPAVKRSVALWLGVPDYPDHLAKVHL